MDILFSTQLLSWPLMVVHNPELDSAELLGICYRSEATPDLQVIQLRDWSAEPTESQIQVLAHEAVHLAERNFQFDLTETQVDVVSAVIVSVLKAAGVLKLGNMLHKSNDRKLLGECLEIVKELSERK